LLILLNETIMKTHKLITLFCSVLFIVPTACNKEYLDPASVSQNQVVNSVDGLIGLVNGMQYRYSVGRQSPVYSVIAASGFTAQEVRLVNAGNTDEANLNVGGGSVDGGNSVVRQLWTQSLLTIKEADLVFASLNIVADPGVRLGIKSYATIFKALSLANMATYFEQVVVTIGDDQSFVSRTVALQQAVDLLQELATELNGGTAIPASFTSRTPNSINIRNTTYALLARYQLELGNYNAALAAANEVDLTVRSFFRYDATNPNPIFNTSNNVLQPRNTTLGLPASLAPAETDGRLGVYLSTPAAGTLSYGTFFNTATSAIPVYLPGEMILIKAEVYARNNQLPQAIEELNKVLTKTAAQDAWGVGADLPAYVGPETQEAILEEIYRQRSIELFMSGSRFADTRRFNRPGPGTPNAERNRNFYPYPFAERDNNPNTPADPAI
jgi:hypothetical protein